MLATLYLISCYLYCCAAVAYLSKKLHYDKKEEMNRLWDSFYDELKEAQEEWRRRDYLLLFFELCDVWHCLARIWQYSLICRLTDYPEKYLLKKWVWIPMALFCPFSTFKIALRYINFGCVRNHWRTGVCTCKREE